MAGAISPTSPRRSRKVRSSAWRGRKNRTVEEGVEGKLFKHTIAEIHASSMRRLSKVEATNDPTDGADEE
jgi:single-strand DNA-binding protein